MNHLLKMLDLSKEEIIDILNEIYTQEEEL